MSRVSRKNARNPALRVAIPERVQARPADRRPWRLGAAGALVLVYAAPLLWPPGPAPWVPDVHAPLLARLFPGVPPLWVAVRLASLCGAAVLLAGAGLRGLPPPFRAAAVLPAPARADVRLPALAVATLQAAYAPWARTLGPAGQVAYLLALAVPPLLLAVPVAVRWRPSALRRALPLGLAIVAWAAICLAVDGDAPRVAHAVDGWRGIVDIHRFVARGKNLLADLLDPELPGLGAALLVFLGLPLFQAGALPLTNGWMTVFQVLSLAGCATGVALLARRLVGPGVALVAVTVFLFSPYIRFVTLVPGPFLAGPIYATGIALCALAASRRRSEAALVALGAVSGVALTFPGVVPVAGLFVAATLWHLRRDWRRVWVGLAGGLAAFAAVVVPAMPEVLTPGHMGQHLGGHGVVALLEPALLGQLPVGAFSEARAVQVSRPLDIVAGAALLPFANPRTAIRLWGDAIFDPIGAVLVAVGLVVCLRAARRSPGARWLLLFSLAALCPAFVSPVDRVDIVHAVTIPVPVALLAAVGFAAVRRQIDWGRWRRGLATGVAIAIAIGGTLLFDVVNPRILAASSMGILFRVLPADAADRVVVLDYPPEHGIDVRWLFTGAMTALGGPRPVGYLAYGGGALPAEGLAADGRDIVVWSPGLEQDLGVRDAVCAAWPGAALLEIWDRTGLSRVHAAFRDGAAWQPAAARWRREECPQAAG